MTNNSEQLQEAPAPIGDSKQIFKNFRDATVALFECDDTPEKLREDLAEAILEAGNFLEAHDTPDCPCPPSAGYTLTRIFGLALPDSDEEAPRPSAHTRQIFKNFRDATVALVDSPECPRDVRDAVSGMLDFFGDFHIAGHTTDARRARYVLSCVFDLDGEDDRETPAPKAPDDYRRTLKNFRAVTEALINCAELPDHSRDVVLRMMGKFDGGGSGDFDGDNARGFGLNGHKDREEAELAEDYALEAAERLADAFATIRELWDYVPAGLHNCPLDHVNGELINSVNWEDDPRAHKRVLMALLQAPEKN